MTLGKSRGFPEPQFPHHCNGDPLALPFPPHTGSRDINSAHLVKCKAFKVIIFSPDLPGAAVLFGDGGGGGCGSDGLGSWGGEGESLSGSERGRFQALGQCEGRRGDGKIKQKLSVSETKGA